MLKKAMTEVKKVIIGKDQAIKYALLSLVLEKHFLIEDIPGVGKTTLVSALTRVTDLDHQRVQFTPDVLPSDITGYFVFNPKSKDFEFQEGAVMTHVLLADEINRTSPKTQAALLEAMEEQQVTVDGKTLPLKKPFVVCATQNPSEHVGTFPLPKSQVDRFFMKFSIGYPDNDSEKIMIRHNGQRHLIHDLTPVIKKSDLEMIKKEIQQIQLHDKVLDYLMALTQETRNHPLLSLGASPRASIDLALAAKAQAYWKGRDYVKPDDVKAMVVVVLNHRIHLTSEAVYEGQTIEDILNDIMDQTPIPI